MPKTDLPLRVFATALPATGRDARVVVALEVRSDREPILKENGSLADALKYLVIAADLKKTRVARATQGEARLVLRARDVVEDAPGRITYQIVTSLMLKPGRYQLRVSANSAGLRKGGSVYLALDVPEFSTTPLALSHPVLGYAAGARVPVAYSTLAAGVLPFAPALDRVFSQTDELRAFAMVRRRNAMTPVDVALAIVGADNRTMRTLDRRIGPRAPAHVDVTLPLRELAPGAYRLLLCATDGVMLVEREVGFLVQ